MRELTALEINQFDFTGQVPDLNLPSYETTSAAPAKTARRVKLPNRKRRLQLA